VLEAGPDGIRLRFAAEGAAATTLAAFLERQTLHAAA
jgi:hypothetical protein